MTTVQALSANYVNGTLYKYFYTMKEQSRDSSLSMPKQDMFVSSLEKAVSKDRKPISMITGNFKNEIKIVFSDIDGTMKDSDGNVTNNARKCLTDLKKNGIPIILSTGRTLTETNQILKNLGIDSSYIITQQGAEVADSKGNIIYQKKLDLDTAKEIVKSFYEYKAKTHITSTKMIIYVDKIPYSEDKVRLPLNWEEIKQVDSCMKVLDKGISPTKIILYDATENFNSIITFMKNKLPKDLNIQEASKGYCEITNHDATKGHAAKVVMKHLGIDPRNAAAIGDADNDVSMLQAVKEGKGLSIAMGNALNSVKNVAEYETEGVNDDGFAVAMQAILKNNKKLSQTTRNHTPAMISTN